MTAQTTCFQVYGLTISGAPSLGRRLLRLDPAPTQRIAYIELRTQVARPTADEAPWSLTVESAQLTFSLGRIKALRDERTIVITTHQPVDTEAIAHPYLPFPCVAFNRWEERDSFHGGAFVHNGQAVVVLGERERGKSTFLAALAHRGFDVLTDDLVVLDQNQCVHVGPRCIDLRPEADPELGGELLELAHDRPRRRIGLPVGARTAPLAAIVELAWGEELRVERLRPSELLALLSDSQAAPVGPARPGSFLDLLTVPAWRYTRPRSGFSPVQTIDPLIDAIA